MGCGAGAHHQPTDEEDEAVQAELAAAGWLSPGAKPPPTKRASTASRTVTEQPPEDRPSPGAKPSPTAAATSLLPAEGAAAEGIGAHGWAVDPGESEGSHGAAPSSSKQDTVSLKKSSVMHSDGGFERALAFAKKVRLFQDVPKAELPLIVKSMEVHHFSPGEAVVSQGAMTDRLFMVVEGQAEASRFLKDQGTEMKLRTLTSGDYFGARGLLLAEAARATVRVVGEQPLCTYSIAHDVFWHLNLKERLHIPKRHHLHVHQEEQDAAQLEKQISAPIKTDVQHSFIVSALRGNVYLPSMCEITDESLQQLATAAIRCTASAGEILFSQGDIKCGRLCIIESGSFELRSHREEADAIGELAGSVGLVFGSSCREAGTWHAIRKAGDTFGEMELFYSLPARATVTAVESAVFWAVGRADFKKILAAQMEVRLARYVKALHGVRCFSGLWNEELRALAAGVTEVSYVKGEDVIVQGEVSSACYVLVQGEAVQLRDRVETQKRYSASDENDHHNFFGATNFANPAKRFSTVRISSDTARVLYIDHETCELILPSVEHLMPMCDSETPHAPKRDASAKSLSQQLSSSSQHTLDTRTFASVKLEDLEFIGNLGQGQFGYVDLAVQKSTGHRYALKRLHTKHFADPAHRKSVKMEKWVLSMTHSPFLVRLYATYKEPRSLAFLLELVTGGDLRHALYRGGVCGNMDCARFYCAGILLAVEHLHLRHIVHRDLKPDNVLLDERGWPKVTDFGLAKFCVGKTYTLSGTPNYMAPEAFQAAGHGLSVDWWSLGCLTYELMAGKTPFESKLGNFQALFININKGIKKPEAWRWPGNFGQHLPRFLFCLLQTDPSNRLPTRNNGLEKIQSHAWYDGFDWPKFKDRLLEPPVEPPSLGSLKPCKSFEETDKAEGDEAAGIDWANDSVLGSTSDLLH